MSRGKYPKGSPPIMVVSNYYCFCKSRDKTVYLRNCCSKMQNMSMNDLENILVESGIFKIIDDENQGKRVEMNGCFNPIIPKQTIENEFLGFLVTFSLISILVLFAI